MGVEDGLLEAGLGGLWGGGMMVVIIKIIIEFILQ